MSGNALVGIRAPLDDVCICNRVICMNCAEDFAETIDPDWTDHASDVWSYLRDYRQHSTAEEWNTALAEWRKDCGL
jgi:hypothetical protein